MVAIVAAKTGEIQALGLPPVCPYARHAAAGD
jgi:hypothetical protein